MGIADNIKDLYYSLEDKYYSVLDKINKYIPIHKIIDPIDKIVPSFLLFMGIVALLIVILAALVIIPPLMLKATVTITVLDEQGKVISKEICTGPHVSKTGELGKIRTINLFMQQSRTSFTRHCSLCPPSSYQWGACA